jgi:hypothetical protein
MTLAMGGGPLVGERIVRLVYMDEAGISHPQQEPFAVVSGVIVNADNQLLILEKYLDALVTEYIPANQRDGFVFHAYQLFGAKGPVFKDREKWPLAKRLEIADELSAMIDKFDIPIQFGWVNRAELLKNVEGAKEASAHDQSILAHAVAFIHCAAGLECWLLEKTSNEVCLLIAEDNEHVRKHIRNTVRENQNPKIYETVDPKARKFLPLTKIKQSPLFEPKTPSSVLQLADYCAYVWKKRLMEDRHYDRFFDPFRGHLAVWGEDQMRRPS